MTPRAYAGLCRWLGRRLHHEPAPSAEAIRAREEVQRQKVRVDGIVDRRDRAHAEGRRLLDENHFAARMQRLFNEGT